MKEIIFSSESMDTVDCDGSHVSRRVKQVVTLQPHLGSREILVFSLISPFTLPQDHGVLNISSNSMWSHLS